MNSHEALLFLSSFFTACRKSAPLPANVKPFLDFAATLKENLPIAVPLLRELGAVDPNKVPAHFPGGLLSGRIFRRYKRLCRVQEELSLLDLKNVPSGVSLEDYTFSRIDFSRYARIDKKTFDTFFLAGLCDFSPHFYGKNFGRGIEGIHAIIKNAYEEKDGAYLLRQKTPLVLSLMRTLETSPETPPLFTPAEIEKELAALIAFVSGEELFETLKDIPDALKDPPELLTRLIYPGLVSRLDRAKIIHPDSMVTDLNLTKEGSLEGIFRPQNKPWTLVLIPSNILR